MDPGGEILGLQDRAGAGLNEAMECMGGNGYVEEAPLARQLSRKVPVKRDLGSAPGK